MTPQFYVCRTTNIHPNGEGLFYPNYNLSIENAEIRDSSIDPFDWDNPYWTPVYVTKEILSGQSTTPYLDYYLLNKNTRHSRLSIHELSF